LIYPGHSLPGFVLPPEDLNQVKLLHGSCRKPHGIGKEMLSSIGNSITFDDPSSTEKYREGIDPLIGNSRSG
jgi:hypothetical protein